METCRNGYEIIGSNPLAGAVFMSLCEQVAHINLPYFAYELIINVVFFHISYTNLPIVLMHRSF